MKSKSLEIRVSTCKNTTANNNHCKPQAEIDEWIKDLQIDMWATHFKMDFNKFHGQPLAQVNDIFTSSIMSTQVQPQELIYLRTHEYETHDSFFNFF